MLPRLERAARARLEADGIPAQHLGVVGGALDGVERALSVWLRAGDRVVVEDPGHPAVLDLAGAMGFGVVPVGMDDRGAVPGELRAALARGAQAVVLTPRAHNPLGAAWDDQRASELRATIRAWPDVLVIEDDHAGPVAGTPVHTLAGATTRWATVRSVSKWLGPDLRLAIIAGDEATISRVVGRQALGTGWVSYMLQETVAELWQGPATVQLLERAAEAYASRRNILAKCLAEHGIPAVSRSGLTTWASVDDEVGVVSGLLEAGWAVTPGQRFRIASAPGIRVAHATLTEHEAARFAADLQRVLQQPMLRAD
jgi:DNA-binding transcriptional MocR family regulator